MKNGQFLRILGVLLTIMGILIGLYVPEARLFLRIDKKENSTQIEQTINPSGVVDTATIVQESILKIETGVFTDERDRHSYKWVKIGDQIWMAENLAFKTNHGCWAYQNDYANVKRYGYLYNWFTAKEICPKGWRLPSSSDWGELFGFLKTNHLDLKNPNVGFNPEKSGYRNPQGDFACADVNDKNWWEPIWWGQDVFMDDNSLASMFCYQFYDPHYEVGYSSKESGFSVRCIKNSETY